MADQKIDVKLDTSGLPLFLLFITFLVLKLTAVINWSWWWVTAPLWAPLGLVLAFLVLAGLGFGVAALLDRKPRRPISRGRRK